MPAQTSCRNRAYPNHQLDEQRKKVTKQAELKQTVGLLVRQGAFQVASRPNNTTTFVRKVAAGEPAKHIDLVA